MPELRFDKKAFRHLKSLVTPFFFSEFKWYAWGMLVLLAILSISISLVNVRLSYANGYLLTALSNKESDEFVRCLYQYLLIFLVSLPIVVFYRYTEERMALLWRRWLSLRILEKYFKNKAYYKINSYAGIDNPDQRLEEDIRSFTTSSLSILLIAFNSIITGVAFVGILWSISFSLIVAVVLYALFGSVVTYLLGRPLIGLNFAQLKKEADYRYKLVNVRDNAESIAFYRGERRELVRTRQRLTDALKNLLSIINWNRNLNFFTTSYNFMIGVIPTIIVAPLFLEGLIDWGGVYRASDGFVRVVNALSIIVLNFGSLSALTAVITRLGSFTEVLEILGSEPRLGERIVTREEEGKLQFKNVSIRTPNSSQDLLSDLSFDLSGKSLLITGPSGSGKSSVLRAFAGIWTEGKGEIVRPKLSDTVFLPQRPYMVLGAFRSQFTYGLTKRSLSDSLIFKAIADVGLSSTLKRVGGLNPILDWPNLLSTGEQQRVAFARLLISKPKVAFLDESTTAIDSASEEKLYTHLKNITPSFVSIGYRANLERFHDYILELQGDGTWTLEEVKS